MFWIIDIDTNETIAVTKFPTIAKAVKDINPHHYVIRYVDTKR